VNRRLPTVTLISSVLCLSYIYLYWRSVSAHWFNPHWSTDDGLQQLFPLHAVFHPDIFKSDLIAEVMQGYLAPLHYGISYLVTLLTHDPIMTGHWVNLIQLVLVVIFVFLIVRRRASLVAALFAVIFLFHTRHLVQRTTGGLPRGWAPAIFASVLYFTISSRHRCVIAALLCGCLLNPPATFLAAFSYGLFLTCKLARYEGRSEALRHFYELLIAAPILILTVLYVAHRPDHIGQMVSYSEASSMPEFQKNGGRFAFVPFDNPWHEIKRYGFQAFIGKLYKPSRFWKNNIYYFVLGILALLLCWQVKKRREIIPSELLIFGLSSIVVYFISRQFAFLLYVPDRHLRAPLAIFFITAFPIGIWRSFANRRAKSLAETWKALAGFALLSVLVCQSSGLGFDGSANFNYSDLKRGRYVIWLAEHAPENALIAGFPTMVDPVPLFSMRKVYASSECWHPFYKVYNQEMKRRIAISLRAHYATNFKDFMALLEPEHVDYFVFERARFSKSELQTPIYFEPFRAELKILASHPAEDYLFSKLPEKVTDQVPYMVFRDKLSSVLDLKKLREYLNSHPELEK